MGYKLAASNGDTLAVPQLVLTHLTQTDGDTIRAALYILQTHDTDPRTMARALALPSIEAAKRTLQYWAGAGLLVSERGAAPAPAAEPARVDLASVANDPYVAVLCQEAQSIFGKTLSRSEMQRLVGLYLNDGWQPDVILLCCAEVTRLGRRTIAAVTHLLARWREDGVETGEDAERWLQRAKQREAWCQDAAAQFGIEPRALTNWERRTIARWHEEMGIGREMIDEALLRANGKNTVRYVDGILRAWRAQGITTIDAARRQGQLEGSNIVMTERPNAQPPAASAQKDLFNRNWAAMFDEEGVTYAHKRRTVPRRAARGGSLPPTGRNAGRDCPPRRLRRSPGAGRGGQRPPACGAGPCEGRSPWRKHGYSPRRAGPRR